MSSIEAIIVNGVRYDKVKAKTQFVCEECDLRVVCEDGSSFSNADCAHIVGWKECWKRKEE